MINFKHTLLLLGLGSSSLYANELLTFSDIHFNPFAECETSATSLVHCPLIEKLKNSPATEWSAILAHSPEPQEKPGQETYFPLLQSTLTFAELNVHPDFIFLGGDYLGHNYREKYRLYTHDLSDSGYQSFVKKTMTFLLDDIHQHFPNVPIITALGNNDSYSGDYVSDPNGLFYREIGNLALPLLKNTVTDSAQFQQTFDEGGYYVASLSSGQELVVLNSVLFSAKGETSSTASTSLSQASSKELSWLRTLLKNAEKNHEKVWVLMHIPDVLDHYASQKAVKSIYLWNPIDDKTFITLLQEYPDTIQLIFTGHFHTDGNFTYSFTDPKTKKELKWQDTYLPGLDSTHGNLPGFKVYSFNPQTFEIESTSLYEEKAEKFRLTYHHA